MRKPGPVISGFVLVSLIALPQLVGYLGASLTFVSVETWYAALEKPAFNPPNWTFGIAWTTLYFLMGLASWLVWRAAGGFFRAPLAFIFYFGQLFLNLAWSYFFFGLQNPAAALIDILLLLAAIIATALLFWRKSRAAGWLFAPYILWVTFATYLNGAILALNG